MIVNKLEAANVVIETDDHLELTAEFHEAWHGEIDRLRSLDRRSYLASFFDAKQESISVEPNPDGSVTVRREDKRIGEWPSKVAIDADIAAFLTLQDWLPEWTDLTGPQRDELVARLRIFLKNCPACDGELESESGANDDVPELVCSECGAALI